MGFTFLTFLTFRYERGRWKARSILGWTPGVRSVGRGRVLRCGCLAGVYEVWTGDVVVMIDAWSVRCTEPQHAEHLVLLRRRRGCTIGELALLDESADVQVAYGHGAP